MMCAVAKDSRSGLGAVCSQVSVCVCVCVCGGGGGGGGGATGSVYLFCDMCHALAHALCIFCVPLMHIVCVGISCFE